MALTGGSTRRAKALSPIPTPRVEDVATTLQATEQPQIFKLQLRPLEDPETFKPSVQLVSREFATRYLESVGVRPSKATMDMVNRNVPLTDAHIKTTLRAKGHVEDEIHISVPPIMHRYRVPIVINPAAVLQLGIGNSVLGSAEADGEEGEQTRPGTSELAEPQQQGDGLTGRPGDASALSASTSASASSVSRAPGGTDFLDMAARYLHPFNLDVTLARKNLTALNVAARAKLMHAGGGGGGGEADNALSRASNAGGGGGAGLGGSSLGASASGRVGALGPLEGRGNSAAAGGASSFRGSIEANARRRPGSWPRNSSGRQLGMPDEGLGGGASGGGGGMAYDAARLEVLEEMAQPLLVTPEVVLTLQAQLEAALADWHRHQAPEALKGRLTAEEFKRTQEELSSEGMVKLLVTLVNFLHEELIRGHPSYPVPQAVRDTARATQLRGHDGAVSERSPQGPGPSGDGASGGLTSRRSHAGGSHTGGSLAGGSHAGGSHAGGSATLRGSVQLPASISIHQMTNLQKYDLGYQAYVRQKLEQRQSQGSMRPEGGTRTQLTTPLTGVESRSNAGDRAMSLSSAGGADRSITPLTALAQPSQQQQQPTLAQQQREQQHSINSYRSNHHNQQQQTGGGALETQRVSFAVPLPHSPLHISVGSPQTGSRPGSPGLHGAPPPSSGSAVSSLFGGPLNLPGSRSRPNTSSHPNTPGTATSRSRAVSPTSTGPFGAAGESLFDRDALASPPIPGLPPHVGRALRTSPSFALASAANTARTIHASLDAEDVAALQRERLFALHADFACRFKALRQSRSGMFFTLPILLLAMRLCVNLLFSTLYPLWTRLPEGEHVLEQMDAALCALFDPHGYLERALSLLQSTPSAIEAVTRHPQRRGNERRHFSDTSPLMQATLQGAKSAGARKLMRATANQPKGLALMRTQLTTEQRGALFQMGLQWMQQPDPVLSQVGEPHAVGRL